MKHRKIDQILPYTYYIQCNKTKIKYYGVRYRNVVLGRTPNEDFANYYFSSGTLAKEFRNNPDNFTYRIHHTFDTKEEACDFEYSFVSRIYKRADWANRANGKLFIYDEVTKKAMRLAGEEILDNGETVDKLRGRLSGETRKSTIESNNKTIAQNASNKASITMSNTKVDGKTLHELRIEKAHKTKSEVLPSGLTRYQEAGLKCSVTKSEVGEDGLTISQRAASINPCCQKGTKESSDIGSKRNQTYNLKLQSMTDEEFTSWCVGRTKGVISGATTRRNKNK